MLFWNEVGNYSQLNSIQTEIIFIFNIQLSTNESITAAEGNSPLLPAAVYLYSEMKSNRFLSHEKSMLNQLKKKQKVQAPLWLTVDNKPPVSCLTRVSLSHMGHPLFPPLLFTF